MHFHSLNMQLHADNCNNLLHSKFCWLSMILSILMSVLPPTLQDNVYLMSQMIARLIIYFCQQISLYMIQGKVEGVQQRLTCFVRTTVVSAERSRGW